MLCVYEMAVLPDLVFFFYVCLEENTYLVMSDLEKFNFFF